MLQSRVSFFLRCLPSGVTVFHDGNSDACISIEVNSIIVLLDEPTLDPRRAFLYKPAARGSSRPVEEEEDPFRSPLPFWLLLRASERHLRSPYSMQSIIAAITSRLLSTASLVFRVE